MFVISLTFLLRRLFTPLPGITFIRRGVILKPSCHWVNVTPALPCRASFSVWPKSCFKKDLGVTATRMARQGRAGVTFTQWQVVFTVTPLLTNVIPGKGINRRRRRKVSDITDPPVALPLTVKIRQRPQEHTLIKKTTNRTRRPVVCQRTRGRNLRRRISVTRRRPHRPSDRATRNALPSESQGFGLPSYTPEVI